MVTLDFVLRDSLAALQLATPTENPTPPSDTQAIETQPADTQPVKQSQDFAAQAEEAQPGLIAEFVDFLLHNKKWWLTPIIIVLLLLGLVMFLGGTVVAPFIYPGA